MHRNGPMTHLRFDVDIQVADDAVDIPEHAGDVLMHVEDAVGLGILWKVQLRRSHTTHWSLLLSHSREHLQLRCRSVSA